MKVNWKNVPKKAWKVLVKLGVVDIMFKKLWKWLWKSAKARATDLVRSQRPTLVKLIKKYTKPEELAFHITEWICKLIDKA